MFKIGNFGKCVLVAGVAMVVYGCDSGNKKETEKKEMEKNVAETFGDKPQNDKGAGDQTKNAPNMKHITRAFCVVNAKGDSEVVGAITFAEADGGVRIIADVGGLKPGKHGFHIHEHGDCSAPDASSAGGHFNPTNKKHGGPDSAERHVGDLGNIEANTQGLAHYDRVDKVISLNGPDSIIGKSIVIHSDEDDLVTDPAGNSGKRIGCGEIVVSDF